MGCGASLDKKEKEARGGAEQKTAEPSKKEGQGASKSSDAPPAKAPAEGVAPTAAATTKAPEEATPAAKDASADETTDEALKRLDLELGNKPRVCILGGTAFRGPDSEELVMLIAKGVSGAVGDRAVFVTGGMLGVQETFAKDFGDKVRNLVPRGESNRFGVGVDIHAGRDQEQRKEIFGLLGDVYLTVEGGPGVAQEARSAHNMGARIVPLIRTGGASAGQFDFPPEALEKPSFATDKQWSLLGDPAGGLPDCAGATAAVIAGLVTQCERAAKCRAKTLAELPELEVPKSEPAPATSPEGHFLGRSIFRAADRDSNGALDREELGQLLARLSPNFCKALAEGIYDSISHHGQDAVTMEVFLDWLENGPDTEERLELRKIVGNDSGMLKVVFRILDRNGNGKIAREEVEKVLGKLANESDLDLKVAFERMDTDKNGEVDFDEFVDAINIDYQALVTGIFASVKTPMSVAKPTTLVAAQDENS